MKLQEREIKLGNGIAIPGDLEESGNTNQEARVSIMRRFYKRIFHLSDLFSAMMQLMCSSENLY